MPSEPSHIAQRDGASRMPLIDAVRPYPDQIRYTLNRMDGVSFWAWSLWRAPEGANLRESLPMSENYIQCAGSAEAMTVEVRTLDAGGAAHQSTVRKPGGDQVGRPSVVIRWNAGRHSTAVYPNEVFTADEAADLFYSYFLTDEVSEPYGLRRVQF